MQQNHPSTERSLQSSVHQRVAEQKVESLAHRSMTLQQIVDFLRDLPHKMQHYRASETKTVDVVWGVIVPATKSRACSYADLVDGCRAMPDSMVSHNWNNIFAHLLASIFACALGIGEWALVLPLMEPDRIHVLEAMLKDCGMLSSRWWLCIFCVNQHISICNATWGGADTVTKIPYRPCDCGQAKHSDGEECEMNKFDQMIELIQKRQPKYKHVIAADLRLGALERIWVIAEVAKVFELGIPFDTLLALRPGVELLYMLGSEDTVSSAFRVDVRKAKASRPEDEELILSKIEDKEEFNRKVQRAFTVPFAIQFVESLADLFRGMDGDDERFEDERSKMTEMIKKIRNGSLEEIEEAVCECGEKLGDGAYVFQGFNLRKLLGTTAGFGDRERFVRTAMLADPLSEIMRNDIKQRLRDDDTQSSDDDTQESPAIMEQMFVNMMMSSVQSHEGMDAFTAMFRFPKHFLRVGRDVGQSLAVCRANYVSVIVIEGDQAILNLAERALDLSCGRSPESSRLLEQFGIEDCSFFWLAFAGGLVWVGSEAAVPKIVLHTGAGNIVEYLGVTEGEDAASALASFVLLNVANADVVEFSPLNVFPIFHRSVEGTLVVVFPEVPLASDIAAMKEYASGATGVPVAYADTSSHGGQVLIEALHLQVTGPTVICLKGSLRDSFSQILQLFEHHLQDEFVQPLRHVLDQAHMCKFEIVVQDVDSSSSLQLELDRIWHIALTSAEEHSAGGAAGAGGAMSG